MSKFIPTRRLISQRLGFGLKLSQLLGLGLVFGLLTHLNASGQTTPSSQLNGDVGLALYHTPTITRSLSSADTLLPYAYADWGPLFARVDTFGLKLLPLGVGHLELSTRVSFEGYKPSGNTGLHNRSTPLPIGLSTSQVTPYGAFFLHGFYDTTSGGSLVDGMYAAEFELGRLKIYPQFGLERRSAAYVDHLYGVSAQENVATLASGAGISVYRPGNSLSPNMGVALEYPIQGDYSFTVQVRKKWLDRSITDSPLVTAKSQLSSFIAVKRSFN